MNAFGVLLLHHRGLFYERPINEPIVKSVNSVLTGASCIYVEHLYTI